MTISNEVPILDDFATITAVQTEEGDAELTFVIRGESLAFLALLADANAQSAAIATENLIGHIGDAVLEAAFSVIFPEEYAVQRPLLEAERLIEDIQFDDWLNEKGLPPKGEITYGEAVDFVIRHTVGEDGAV